MSLHGQRETANAFLVNGGDVSEDRHVGAGLIPNLDSIAQFRLISNDKFDARNFFDPTKAALQHNQFGYSVGGPFWKNELFRFTDYQGTRQVAGDSTGLVDASTTAERSRNFGAGSFLDFAATPPGQGAYRAQAPSQRLGYPVQNGGPYNAVFPNGVIPQSAWAKPTINLLPYSPAPNAGDGLFSDSSHRKTINDDKMGQCVDFNNERLSAGDRLRKRRFMTSSQPKRVAQFDPFELDLSTAELRRNGRRSGFRNRPSRFWECFWNIPAKWFRETKSRGSFGRTIRLSNSRTASTPR